MPGQYVYIACPYTLGDVGSNVRNSILTASTLTDFGYVPFCPLLFHFWHLLEPHPHDYWMKLDLAWILRCDIVLRIPGASFGADTEVKYAKAHNIPVVFSLDELREVAK